MANRQGECIKVRKCAFSIRLDLLGTFYIKAKAAEELSMASFDTWCVLHFHIFIRLRFATDGQASAN
jgi:hypothetical protein